MQLKRAILDRKNVKRYSEKKPDWRRIIRAIDAARFSPSADNQFVMKFILVDDVSKISELTNATQQNFVGTAKYLVVAISNNSKLIRSYGDFGPKYSSQQSGATIENFLLSLTEEGLVTYWIRYFHEDQVKRILRIPEDLVIDGIFPIGHETKIKTKSQKVIDLENIIYFNKWGSKKMVPQTRIKSENA